MELKRRGWKRKLNQEQEREAALASLCGVKANYIGGRYGISEVLIYNLILPAYSREWNDPLVEFYRQASFRRREMNSAHLFLSFQKSDLVGGSFVPEPRGLINFQRDRPVYELVKEAIYKPGIEEIVDRTALREYTGGNHPYDLLLERIFGEERAERIAHDALVAALREAYKPGEWLSLKKVFHSAGDRIIGKVREGGLAWTGLKKGIVHETLEDLRERTRTIIGVRFGLDGYGSFKTNKELGQDYSVTHQMISGIELRALSRLKDYSSRRILESVWGLATDAEVKTGLEELLQHLKSKERWRKKSCSQIEELLKKAAVLGKAAAEPDSRAGVGGYSAWLEREEGTQAEKDRRGEELAVDKYGRELVETMELSVRARNCLLKAGIRIVGELAVKTESELLRIPGLGMKSLRLIKEELSELGLVLGMRR